MMPDRRGNNRIDSLRNIVRDPRIALLFLIPGAGTTLRINGRAHLSTDAALLASFAMQGKAPRTVISPQSASPSCWRRLPFAPCVNAVISRVAPNRACSICSIWSRWAPSPMSPVCAASTAPLSRRGSRSWASAAISA